MSLAGRPLAGKWEPAPSPERQLLPPEARSTVCRVYVLITAGLEGPPEITGNIARTPWRRNVYIARI